MNISFKFYYSFLLSLLLCFPSFSDAQIKILFDCKKAETVANADWVVDADLYNLGNSPTGIMVTGNGSEANPQSLPTPSQSGINTNTQENYWKGAISAWGVQMAKLGYIVETLPNNGSITYGNSSNAQDLSNYKVYVVVEPNILFTTSEKIAIMNFVQNGGGLFMIGNHSQSDRNFDGFDSPMVWNDLINNNTIQSNAFGLQFNYDNFSQTTSNVPNYPSDSITNGPMGSVTRMRFSSGTSMTLNTSSNPSLKGVIFRTGSAIGDTGVMMAYGRYGRGKFVGLGDSSPADDGTGDLNDVLYDGWAAEVNGDHGKVITNATIWLAAIDNITGFNKFSIENNFYWNIFPNPAIDEIKLYYQLNETSNIIIELHNSRGEKVKQYVYENQQSGSHYITMNDLSNGFYFIKINVNGNCFVKRLIVSGKE